MTKEELAERLDMQYLWYIGKVKDIAEENNLVIIVCTRIIARASGAISDAIERRFDTGSVKFGELPESIKLDCTIRGIWGSNAIVEYTCDTDMPNAKFDIYGSDNQVYQGLVIDLNEIKEMPKKKEQKVKCCKQEPCSLCLNARVIGSDELNDDNDFSATTIGEAKQGFVMFLNSGNGEPVNIEVTQWNNYANRQVTIAKYYPKYCPNCGRRLDEYEEK